MTRHFIKNLPLTTAAVFVAVLAQLELICGLLKPLCLLMNSFNCSDLTTQTLFAQAQTTILSSRLLPHIFRGRPLTTQPSTALRLPGRLALHTLQLPLVTAPALVLGPLGVLAMVALDLVPLALGYLPGLQAIVSLA